MLEPWRSHRSGGALPSRLPRTNASGHHHAVSRIARGIGSELASWPIAVCHGLIDRYRNSGIFPQLSWEFSDVAKIGRYPKPGYDHWRDLYGRKSWGWLRIEYHMPITRSALPSHLWRKRYQAATTRWAMNLKRKWVEIESTTYQHQSPLLERETC